MALLAWAPSPVRSAAALDSHRSSNPTVNCACKGSRLHAPYENFSEITFLPLPQPPGPWKNCLPWNRSLVPKGWGPLLERFLILCLLTFQPRLPPLASAKLILLAWQFSMIHANELVIIVVETNILRLSLTGWPLLLTNSECSLYVKIMNSETRLLYTRALLFTSHVTSG